MTTVKVTVWTVQYVHGTSNKFYRCYMIRGGGGQQFSVTQWGRNGTVGSFRCVRGVDNAIEKRDEKEKEGYSRVPNQYNVDMTVDLDRFKAEMANGGDKAAGEYLDQCFRTYRGGADQTDDKVMCLECGKKFNTHTDLVVHQKQDHPREEPDAVPDRLGVLADKASEVLALAAEDPIKAQVALVSLREQREAIALDLRRADSYLDTAELLIEEADA